MRKLTCILLTLIMVIGTAAFSFADVSEPVVEEVTAAQLEQQSKEALEYIQTHLVEIDAEIAEYNRTHANDPSPRDISYGGFTYKTGDILVTTDTFGDGILGHAGIMMDGKVLEITPKHKEGKPNILSVADWRAAYPSTLMVVRYTGSSSKAISAAQWGYTKYGAPNAPFRGDKVAYAVTAGIYEYATTYCSKLVWNCYYDGAGITFELWNQTPTSGFWGVPTSIMPYDFIRYREHNGFSAVYRIGDWSGQGF